MSSLNPFSEYIITSLEPKGAMRIYKQRIKIERSFRDMKKLLRIERNMGKSKERMGKLMNIYGTCFLRERSVGRT